MTKQSLSDRQKAYENAFDHQIIRRVPVIIRVDGRSFTRLLRDVEHPFCSKVLELMCHTMLELCRQVDGVCIGYQQSDEISLVVRNDQELNTTPWFANRIQKMTSVASSIATYAFNTYLWRMPHPPNITGDPLFDTRVFAVPDINEAINYLVWRQQDCTRNALASATYAEVAKRFDREVARDILHGASLEEREDILMDRCGIDFYRYYNSAFIRGVAGYLAPKIVDDITRHQWVLDIDLPKFSDDRSFVDGILRTGSDIFRPTRDLDNMALPRVAQNVRDNDPG